MKIYKVTSQLHNTTTHHGYFDREALLDLINTLSRLSNQQSINIVVDKVKTNKGDGHD